MFTVTIKTGGSAFDPEPEHELARILRTVAERVEAGERSGSILDINGNTVGNFNGENA